ncbi:MAG TPA: hypothetical protein VFN74_16370, partial [Chloroflexota bacterium]|nr:hypothetical protein [Chloroflexota bacterium]
RVILPLLTPLTLAPLAATPPPALPAPIARALSRLRRPAALSAADSPTKEAPALTTADRLLQRKRRVRF